jgi:hypothetical protein
MERLLTGKNAARGSLGAACPAVLLPGALNVVTAQKAGADLPNDRTIPCPTRLTRSSLPAHHAHPASPRGLRRQPVPPRDPQEQPRSTLWGRGDTKQHAYIQ